jgi:hypothetical protein
LREEKSMLKTILGIFLIGHGIAHAGLASAPDPSESDSAPGAFFTQKERSRLFQYLDLDPILVQRVGIVLVVISVLGFILVGMGVLGVPGLEMIWQGLALISAAASLILLILFWHPWIILGVVIDIGLFLLVVLNSWPQ